MNYVDNILELIGKTPMVKIQNGCPHGGPLMLAKLEYQNPTGSVKDRMAYYIVKKALEDGDLKPGGTVIDNTSGNAGVSLALVASMMGVKAILTTPQKTSQEKVDLIRAYGAEVIVTPSDTEHDDPEGAYMKAIILAKKHGYFHMNQYHSKVNISAHYLSTGPEIWDDTDGRITHLVAGIGTGGTLSGSAKYLKEKNPEVKAIAVDPEGSVFYEYVKNGTSVPAQAYKIEGIGSDVITGALDPDIIDEIIPIPDELSFLNAREFALQEGILGGGSTGSAVWAARKIAGSLNETDVVVVIIPDSGNRYLSKCFSDRWMKANGFDLKPAEPVKTEVP